MEADPHESEHSNAGSNDNISYQSSTPHSSAWSQISKKFRLKGKEKVLDKAELEINKSVFEPIPTLQDWKPNISLLTPNHEEPLTNQKFIEIVESVKAAIAANIQPTRISQGSSGSYFCRNKEGKVVGVFKPKNEEPYGQLNPKWTKWIHRNLFPCFFGRSCLIPNLGYISESAASLLDNRLLLNMVPVTEVIRLSSSSFHYDRRAAKLKPLPDKIGSFQVFLDGFKDANVFLREHPWPENNNNASTIITETDVIGNKKRRLNVLICGQSDLDDGETSESYQLGKRFVWTPELQIQFREQFEKLVILDYLMRNTDRGPDNWMIKYCVKDEQCIKNTPPTSKVMKAPDILTKENATTYSKDNEAILISAQGTNGDAPPPLSPDGSEPSSSFSEPLLHLDNQEKSENPPEPVSSVSSPPSISSQTGINSSQRTKIPYPHIHVAAIDNGLAFPFKHPDKWRSYPYGWLYLSESLIKQPFTSNTRNHFLSILSDPKWWKETVNELHNLFSLDDDFEPGMFAKQIAVLKGQGWNIVETLKEPNQGPLDLCARQNVMVWDEVEDIEIPLELDQHKPNNRNINGVDINAGVGISTENDEGGDTFIRSDSYIFAPSAPRHSLTEDNSERISLSTSAPATTSFPTTFSKPKWKKLKEKFEKFNVSKNKDKLSLEKRTKQVINERLEYVKGGTPFFTWC
ncbi:phosphatidylinositol 3 and 4-kinase-domain-containing protein [Glomus cerebriforme]|uniref:Phosphatidylinositol 4-kinase n=1 Tax=Glomus cerebriforme TaxID=658196 RepID=A0A397T3G7_9GLOM|nr:phosphatidylinositol 3 and 4-kinase-domain-containing protein [Glomus cerebriforme]